MQAFEGHDGSPNLFQPMQQQPDSLKGKQRQEGRPEPHSAQAGVEPECVEARRSREEAAQKPECADELRAQVDQGEPLEPPTRSPEALTQEERAHRQQGEVSQLQAQLSEPRTQEGRNQMEQGDLPQLQAQPSDSRAQEGEGRQREAQAEETGRPVPPPAYRPPADRFDGQRPRGQQVAYEGVSQQAYQEPGFQHQAFQQMPQVVYASPQQPQKNSRSWIVAVVFIVCLFAFTAFCVKSCTDAVSGMSAGGIASAGPSGDSVAVINIDGTIQYDGTANSPEGLKTLLDRAADDDRIKAVVLRVNSGGGTATAGEEMATYLRQFNKPVVVSSASINASAAYEISSQADYIFVAKSTEIGAIGTAMQLTDLSGLLEMLGVNMEVLTSAESKDSSYGYRPLTDAEREYYQRMIEQINTTFIDNVAQGRKMSTEEVRALATGLVFTGIDAVENGLADEFGTLEDAADKAAELAGVSDYDLYDLAFTDYDISGLYSLLGSSNGNDQRILPLLKQ